MFRVSRAIGIAHSQLSGVLFPLPRLETLLTSILGARLRYAVSQLLFLAV